MGEDKPFVAYKHGWSLQIVPRNAAGWRALGLWLLSLVPLVVGFIWIMAGVGEDSRSEFIATIAFVIATLAWSAAMIRWMYVRSEVIDLRALIDLKRRGDKGRKS